MSKKEKKYEITTKFNIRLVLEQVQDTNDPHVLGYPETEELEEIELFSTNVKTAADMEFENARGLFRYLHVEKGQISQKDFNIIGDAFIDACKRMGLSVASVRYVLRSLMFSFNETVKEGKWRKKK